MDILYHNPGKRARTTNVFGEDRAAAGPSLKVRRNFRLHFYTYGRFHGGFGYANRDILRCIGAEYGIRFSKIIAAPMEGLIEYHR